MAMRDEDFSRRIAAGDDVFTILDERAAAERARSVVILRRESGDEAAEAYLAAMREVDLGIYNARGTWHALSAAQRHVLREAAQHGCRLDRIGKGYRNRARSETGRQVSVATVRNLCRRDLMAWDGTAFDPESAVVVTERGHFVLKHGPE